MPRHLKYGLIVLLIVFVAGLAYYFNLQEKIRQLVSSSPEPVQPYLTERPVFTEGTPTRRIKLFFPSSVRDGMLEPEDRDIHVSSQVTDEAKQIVAELIKGSKEGKGPALPLETKLRGVFLCADGLAVVDLTQDVSDRHPGGLTQEVSTVYAIVNSLTENISAIQKVQILIEGKEAETLAGHVVISKPFLQDLSMTPLPPR
jgi:spore germination protein GerM